MRMPQGLRRLDDRVLGRPGAAGARDQDGAPDGGAPATREGTRDEALDDGRGDAGHHHVRAGDRTERVERTTTRSSRGLAGNGDGASKALAVVWRVSRLVLLALALVVLAAAALILLPANEDNVLVRNVLSLAETVAGPFRDVFEVEDPDRMRVVNYGLAAVAYFVLASVVGRLPTGSKRS